MEHDNRKLIQDEKSDGHGSILGRVTLLKNRVGSDYFPETVNVTLLASLSLVSSSQWQ